jgi:hypothetical protein
MLERAPILLQTRTGTLATWLTARRTILGAWVVSEAIVIGASLALHWLHEPRGYFGPKVFSHALGPLEAWDGVWYRRIADHGYLLVPAHQSSPAFFPLYPVLLRPLDWLGLSTAAGGVVLSAVLFLFALLAFDELGHRLLSSHLARRATLLLSVFPTTYVCSMVYPESLVLLAFALTGLYALRGRWLVCAVTAAVAALARPEGVLLALPIAGCLASYWPRLTPDTRGRGIAAVLAAPAAALAFPLYLGWALHDPLAWTKAQRAWGRSFRLDGIWHAISRLPKDLGTQPWGARDVAFCLVVLALTAVAWRAGIPRAWLALGVLTVMLPLGSGSFKSDARFGLLALPVYWGLAWLCRDRRLFAAVFASSAVLLAAATVTLPLIFP